METTARNSLSTEFVPKLLRSLTVPAIGPAIYQRAAKRRPFGLQKRNRTSG